MVDDVKVRDKCLEEYAARHPTGKATAAITSNGEAPSANGHVVVAIEDETPGLAGPPEYGWEATWLQQLWILTQRRCVAERARWRRSGQPLSWDLVGTRRAALPPAAAGTRSA